MTAPQTKSMGPLPDSFKSTALRYLGNRWFLVAAAGLTLVATAALSWSWLVAAGVASILLSVLPCLVMCGLGLCMHKFRSSSGSAQVSGSAVADAPERSGGAETESSAAYAGSCCGGVLVNTANPTAKSGAVLKEKTDA